MTRQVTEIVIIETDDTTGESYERHFPISDIDRMNCEIHCEAIVQDGLDIPMGQGFTVHTMDRIIGVDLTVKAEVRNSGDLPPMWWILR